MSTSKIMMEWDENHEQHFRLRKVFWTEYYYLFLRKSPYMHRYKKWSEFLRSKNLGISYSLITPNYKVDDIKLWMISKIKYGL